MEAIVDAEQDAYINTLVEGEMRTAIRVAILDADNKNNGTVITEAQQMPAVQKRVRILFLK